MHACKTHWRTGFSLLGCESFGFFFPSHNHPLSPWLSSDPTVPQPTTHCPSLPPSPPHHHYLFLAGYLEALSFSKVSIFGSDKQNRCTVMSPSHTSLSLLVSATRAKSTLNLGIHARMHASDTYHQVPGHLTPEIGFFFFPSSFWKPASRHPF
jgi:hypothetical protein